MNVEVPAVSSKRCQNGGWQAYALIPEFRVHFETWRRQVLEPRSRQPLPHDRLSQPDKVSGGWISLWSLKDEVKDAPLIKKSSVTAERLNNRWILNKRQVASIE